MSRPFLRLACAAAAATLTLPAPAMAAAAEFKPDRPLEIVVAATPGGGYDNLARPLQRILQEQKLVDRPVVLVHKPGAGGTIGWNSLNQRPADGHMVSIISGTILGAQIMGRTPVKYTDFTILPMAFNEYLGFHVRTDSPITGGRDMLDRFRKDPQALSITPGTSVGTLPHIALALVLKTGGFTGDMRKLKVVSFNSTGESATAVAGGHIDILASRPSNVTQLVKAGKMRTLAVTAPQRMAALPDVPTWRELGVDAVYGNWFGMIGPKAMTPAQVAYWDDVMLRLTRTSEWKAELEKNLWTDFHMSSARSRQFLDQQDQELRTLMTEIGLAKDAK
jgi:putative tricarboxylic transport membrane protein